MWNIRKAEIVDTETLFKDKNNTNSKCIAISAILLGCMIASALLPSINTPIIRIGFAFIPLLIGSMMLPTIQIVTIAVLADIIKYFLFYSSFGPYNLGISISAGICALIYSLFLNTVTREDWKFDKNFIIRAVFSSILSTVICDLGITTFSLSIMNGKAWIAILIPRIYSESILLILHILVILLIAKLLFEYKNNKLK